MRSVVPGICFAIRACARIRICTPLDMASSRGWSARRLPMGHRFCVTYVRRPTKPGSARGSGSGNRFDRHSGQRERPAGR